MSTDVLVVGAGPAGASAAAWAARAGRDVLIADAQQFPRDKTCGDGLTPRAVAELDRLGLGDWVRTHTTSRGLRLIGFGHDHALDWPGGSFPAIGSAVARTELDDRLRRAALDSGATPLDAARAVDVERAGDRIVAVLFETVRGPVRVAARRVVVADGVRSPLGRVLGRTWHRDTVYGVAVRAYVATPRSEDPWITSHLELRGRDGALTAGYGWIFPLGGGLVNIGVGSLATAKRPAPGALRPLLDTYVNARRDEWGFDAAPHGVASALLPMGGAVSGVAGANWALVGDAAGCVNPLNGEGIDYGLEGGRLLADVLDEPDLTSVWPAILRARYGRAFSIARRVAGLATRPALLRAAGPTAMASRAAMGAAVRMMGNLVADDDTDAIARLWRTAGRASQRADRRPPFS
ncbi:geranylgeranyl reductase family protein [Rhodococcus rhodnii]|nr:geranylgeranyl reductase family protein [Rhodococcus rhodnii]TXG92887.1 geranylgeranyl reductase family protein [Rhodococcus rhodnii]